MIIKEDNNIDYKDSIILNVFKQEIIHPYTKKDSSINKKIIIFEKKSETFKIRNNNCFMRYNQGVMVFNDFNECFYIFKLKNKNLNLNTLVIKEEGDYILITPSKEINNLFKVKVESIF